MTELEIPQPPIPLLHTHEWLLREVLAEQPGVEPGNLQAAVQEHAERTGYMHPGPSGVLCGILSRSTETEIRALLEWMKSRL